MIYDLSFVSPLALVLCYQHFNMSVVTFNDKRIANKSDYGHVTTN